MREADSYRILEKLPPKLAKRLMPFQRDGIKYALKKNGRCLIADEMGLGKTLQALSVAYLYKSEWPLLIIVPSSLRFCWVEEIEKWFPDTSPEDIFMVQTGNDASGIQNAKIVIATYGLLSKTSSKVVLQALTNQNFQVVIVDESHYIRNIKTASCKAISPLIRNANRRILLSGTPSLSKPVELFSQVDAICPNKFGSWWTYTAHFCDARIQHIGKIRKRNVDGASNLAELQKKLKDVLMIRRMKDDVLTQLPAKQRQQILFQLKDSQVTKDIQKTFQELKSSMKKDRCQVENVCEVATNDGCSGNTLSLIQKLYQLSGEAKIGPARDYVAMLCDNKNLKFLVFAYHHAMMNGLQQTLMEHDVKFVRIDGETKPSDRQLYVQQFQSDPDTRVAILSILAAGVGLTFTKATLVVFAEMYWTPGVLIQCEDRAHRIGQTRCVSVHYLVAKDTMDEWVWSAICRKTIVTTTTLNGQKQVMKADKGDKYQVDLLSTADVYKAPSTEEAANTDFASIFASQQPKDQPSILDFISSGKKRKREEGSVFRKKRKNFNKTQDSDDVIELLDSDGENEMDEIDENRISTPNDKYNTESHSQENSSKLKGKIKNVNQMLLFPQGQNDEEDEFVFGRTKLTRKPLHIKQSNSFSDTWGCSGCTFQNHADLPYCEMCNTPKHNRSVKSSQNNDEGSLTASPDQLVKNRVVESQENSNILKCDIYTCDNENISQLSESHHLCSSCDNSCSSLNEDESFHHKDSEEDRSACDQCEKGRQSDEEESFSTKSKQRRRTFFLETYSPTLKSGADHSSQSSENSSDIDQCTTRKQTIYGDNGKENVENEEKKEGNDQEMTSSLELTKSGQSTVELQSSEDSSQPTQSALSDSMMEDNLDITRETDDVEEMFDEDWDQEILSQDVETTKTEDNIIVKDISAVPVYKSFWYKCSAYTSRIYLYNENGDSLQANFVPLDVEMNNQGNLPDILLHPQNFRLVQKFMREWNSLTETKRRLIVKSSTLFDSPRVAYESLKSDRCVTVIRHKTKEDIAAESLAKAGQIQGNIRVVKRSHQSETSLVQATTSEGIPICLNCSKPCDSSLLSKETLKDSDSAWATRFCSQKCMNKYWIQTNSSYCRDQLYEAEHGICQLCSFDAHSLYKQIRDTDDMQKRVDILHSSIFDKLNPKQKEAIVKNPVAGQFWHVDHIRAVWEGGGQCDIDNFRTLCVLCHQKVTAQQARKRATIRKLGAATGMADISAFFQPA